LSLRQWLAQHFLSVPEPLHWIVRDAQAPVIESQVKIANTPVTPSGSSHSPCGGARATFILRG